MQHGHILIVDDESSICAALKRLLRTHVGRVTTTTDTTEAYKLLETGEIDIFICDLNMPDISGTELLELSRQVAPATLRLVITGANDYYLMVDTINKCGLFGYIPKPWDDEAVVQMIRNAVSFKAMQDEQQ